jgi:uncharacterized protein (TIGR03435 family)
LNLRPVQTPNQFASIGYARGRWVIAASTAAQLAKYASDYKLHAPVLDQTELIGAFDYTQPVPDLDPDYNNNSESFLRMITQLGLKLDRSQGPVEILVIEQAQKPSAN